MKAEGLIHHVGLATHYIPAFQKAIAYTEIEILHPLINRLGRGLLDGPADEMAKSIAAQPMPAKVYMP